MPPIDPAPQPTSGLLDTCVVIDLSRFDPADLPDVSYISTITMAELSYGVALATSGVAAATRSQVFASAKAWFQPLPFDGPASERYGELAALVLAAGRQPRPRRFDLMIAAIAATHHLPLYTANPHDFHGLESVVSVIAVTPKS